MHILVIEDFAPLRQALEQGLAEAGYAVNVAANGEDGLQLARAGGYDVIILDLMLPKIDGLTVLRELQHLKSTALTLILTAKDAPDDRIAGLDAGADDYVVKPFVFGELLARVRALVRRKYEVRKSVVKVGNLELDLTRRSVKRGEETIVLSGREYALLEYLALNANRIVTRGEIWQHVYDFNASLESNVIDVFMGLLRKKIERPNMPRLLHTRRGQGYMLSETGEAA